MHKGKQRNLVLSLLDSAPSYSDFKSFVNDVAEYYIRMKFKDAPLREEANRLRWNDQYAVYIDGVFRREVFRKGKMFI